MSPPPVGGVVLLALEVLGDGVARDDQPAGVLHGLQVPEDRVIARHHPGLVGEELQVTVDPGGDDLAATIALPVLELHAAADLRAFLDSDGLETLALDVADDPHAVGG